MSDTNMSKVYMINGIEVRFPYKAYPAQISAMSHILNALQTKKNALIESPTGSGKTMTLLCASLAWQQKLILENQKRSVVKSEISDKNHGNKLPMPVKQDIPVIFYCSRTHKQLDQVVSELKKTFYANKLLKMTVLSSREQSCINKEVLTYNKTNNEITEACQNLIITGKGYRNSMCSYYKKIGSFSSYKQFRSNDIPTYFSTDELKKFGLKCNFCPFFVSKELTVDANLILCPYNYIIVPSIRKGLDINLKNAIVVIDEAHNIEDSSRTASSFTFTVSTLNEIINETKSLSKTYFNDQSMKESYLGLNIFLKSLIQWLTAFDDEMKSFDYSTQEHIIKGHSILDSLINKAAISSSAVNLARKYLKIFDDYKEEMNSSAKSGTDNIKAKVIMELPSSALNFINDLLDTLDILFLGENYECYVATISKVRQKRQKNKKQAYSYTGNFVCLDPSIAFRSLTNNVHSVILTSGTLSPICSFEPELGTKFDIIYEAQNVRTTDNAWVCGLGVSPSNKQILVTYKNYSSIPMQDDIGKIILDICKNINYGVLCFFPSFNVLEILVERWKKTSLWEELNSIKHVFEELKASTKDISDPIFEEYKKCSIGDKDIGLKKGAILFAVCRGKSSEGIDFCDEMARTVITIGIPFPNIRSAEIKEKIDYNNRRHKISPAILEGEFWYKIQTYRALNQALGRCIRHKDDWGAIIMLDIRFCTTSTAVNAPVGYLSKWIREKINGYKHYPSFLKCFKSYVNERQDSTKITIRKNDLLLANQDIHEENDHLSINRDNDTNNENDSLAINNDIKENIQQNHVMDNCNKIENSEYYIIKDLNGDPEKISFLELNETERFEICSYCKLFILKSITNYRLINSENHSSECILIVGMLKEYKNVYEINQDLFKHIEEIKNTSYNYKKFQAYFCEKTYTAHLPMICKKCSSKTRYWISYCLDGCDEPKIWLFC